MDYGFNTAAADAVTRGMRPSEYMRLSQPELFSDSGEDVAFKLDRAVFEYHLDTLAVVTATIMRQQRTLASNPRVGVQTCSLGPPEH